MTTAEIIEVIKGLTVLELKKNSAHLQQQALLLQQQAAQQKQQKRRQNLT